MNKSLIICDRWMYGALLVMIFFLPYSLMMISVCQGMMAITWVVSCILSFRASCRREGPRALDFTSGSMIWPLIAIGLLIALTIPFSHYPSLSFKKLGTRFLFPVLLMYLVTQIVHSRKRLYVVLAVLMAMVFFVSVEALSQYVWGLSDAHYASLTFGRVSGPMHHANDLGTLLVTLLPIALVLVITCREWVPMSLGSFGLPVRKAPWMGVVVLVLFLVVVSALGLTSSRGAWVAFAVSMITLGFCLRRRRVMVSIVLMLALFLWAFGMYCLSTRLDLYSVPMTQGPVMKPSFTNPWGLPAPYNALQLFSGSSGRDSYWDMAVVVIKQHPWFGCGYNAYIQTLKDMHVNQEYPHNSLLHITAELGIIGLIFYLWLFVALCLQVKNVLRAVFHERDLFLLGCGISCGILAWLIHSLMDTPWSSLQLSILLWLMIGVLMSLEFVFNRKEGEKACR